MGVCVRVCVHAQRHTRAHTRAQTITCSWEGNSVEREGKYVEYLE